MKKEIEAAFDAFCKDSEQMESVSALLNEDVCVCPKCKKSFGVATVDGFEVYYCEPCRVTHPIPTNVMAS